MVKKVTTKETVVASRLKSSALLDTRVVYCGDNLEQLAKLPDACVDLIYIDPPFNSNRNYEVFWGETKEKRAFEDRHENTKAYIDYPIQVKQKDKAGRPDIDAFEAMMMREDCEKGFFVSFDYSSDALQEIESFFKRSHKVIVALTVQEILDEHIAKKLV